MAKPVGKWTEAFANYDLALRTVRPNGSQSRDVLRRLDTSMYTHLPILISSRSPHHITATEYTLIVEWKLRRGVWRPQTLPFARTATDDEVRTASANAFKQLEQGNFGEAVDVLIPLPGSSPSIASAILSVYDSSIPFMSCELLQATQGKIDYFRSTFLEVVKKVNAKARFLSLCDVTKTWTSVDVEKAIYAHSQFAKLSFMVAANTDIDATHINDPPKSTGRVPQRMDAKVRETEPVSLFSGQKQGISIRQKGAIAKETIVSLGQNDIGDEKN